MPARYRIRLASYYEAADTWQSQICFAGSGVARVIYIIFISARPVGHAGARLELGQGQGLSNGP